MTFSESSKKLKFIFGLVLVVAIVGAVSSAYLWNKVKYLENPTPSTQEEIKQLVIEVGKFLVLPTDETPTLATISDPEKLRDQPFFANAEAGDKVLIYTVSRKAILWRPSISKIVEISTLNPSSALNQTDSTGITP